MVKEAVCDTNLTNSGINLVQYPHIQQCVTNLNMLIIIGIIEHLLIGIKLLLAEIIEDEPEWVLLMKKKENLRREWDAENDAIQKILLEKENASLRVRKR